MKETNTNKLEKSVLKTLAFYAALKTPLTLPQVGRYLINTEYLVLSTKLSEIENVLDNLIKNNIVTKQKGLYWLSSCNAKPETGDMNNKPSLYMKFIQSEKIAQRKINLVRKALKIFRFVPGLRGIFICGSVARGVCQRNSDIDFLILTEKGRVWTVRFFLTAIAFLLGKKTRDAGHVSSFRPAPRGDTKFQISRKNKFCLNHYRSTAKLKLEKDLQDLYSAQEYARIINLYETATLNSKARSSSENFFKENAGWMGKFLPNFNFAKPPIYRKNCAETRHVLSLRKKASDLLEKILQPLQAAKIQKSSQNFAQLDKLRIIANNNVIMFHLNPQAPIVIEKYNNFTLKTFSILNF